MANTLQPPSVSVPRAKGYTSYQTGQCLNFVWKCIDGVTMAGYPDANTAFKNSKKVHAGDKNPPAGVPCYWTGSQYGHVALSLGDGNVRSTDYPSKGKVSTVSITTLTNAWGRKYEGWAEDYGGNDIPGISTDPDNATGDDMPSASEIANAVWNLVIPRPDNTPTAAKGQLGSANVNSYRALTEVRALTSMVEDMAAKVLTSEEFDAAIARARAAVAAARQAEDEETGEDEADPTARAQGGPGEDAPSLGEGGRREGQRDG